MTPHSPEAQPEWIAEKNAAIESVVKNFEKKFGTLRNGVEKSIFKNSQITTIGSEKYLQRSDGMLHKLDDITAEGAQEQGLKTLEQYEKEEGIVHQEAVKDYFGEDFQSLQNLITEYSNSFDGFGNIKNIATNLSNKLKEIDENNLDESGKEQYADMQKNITQMLAFSNRNTKES